MTDTAPDSLDAAWAAVEAVLPEGWHLASFAHDGPLNPGWYVDARPDGHRSGRYAASGPTPVAALRALEAKLKEAPDAR
jgi:hypothetical protein